uniref:PH domain-containing protein n=1 Tax=Rhabditophanes sp. KR3021 TaxID=114890 RepID=A0AC35THZ2_9BILA
MSSSSSQTCDGSQHSHTIFNVISQGSTRGTEYIKQGWLVKSKISKLNLLKTKWSRRYVILKQLLTHKGYSYYLELYKDEEEEDPKKIINLSKCLQLDSYLQLKKGSERFNVAHEWIFSLHMKKKDEIFFAASTEHEMNSWVHMLSSVCDLEASSNPSNPKSRTTAGAILPHRTNNQYSQQESFTSGHNYKKQSNAQGTLPSYMQNKMTNNTNTYSPLLKKRINSTTSIQSAPFDIGSYNTSTKKLSTSANSMMAEAEQEQRRKDNAFDFSQGYNDMMRLSNLNLQGKAFGSKNGSNNTSNSNSFSNNMPAPPRPPRRQHQFTIGGGDSRGGSSVNMQSPITRSYSILTHSENSTLPRNSGSRNNSIQNDNVSIVTCPDQEIGSFVFSSEANDSLSEDNDSLVPHVLVPMSVFNRNFPRPSGSIRSASPSIQEYIISSSQFENYQNNGHGPPPVDRSKKPNRRKKSTDTNFSNEFVVNNYDHQFTYPIKMNPQSSLITVKKTNTINRQYTQPKHIIHNGKRYQLAGPSMPTTSEGIEYSYPINTTPHMQQLVFKTVKEKIVTTGPKESPAAAMARMKKLKKDEKAMEKELQKEMKRMHASGVDYTYVDTAKTKAMAQTFSEDEKRVHN